MMSSGAKPMRSRQQCVGALADRHLALDGVGLASLVEGHDDHGGAVAHTKARVREERLLALLEADRIDDGLALHALEARLDHRPLRRIDHDGHARDVRLARDEAQEFRHGRCRIEHALVHVHIDDLRAVGHLLPGDVDGGAIVAGFDELAKLGRAGHVGALADVDEQAPRIDGERFQAAQPASGRDARHQARRNARDCANHGANVLRRRAAAAAQHIEEPAGRELAEDGRGLLPGSRRIRRTHSASPHSGRRTRRCRRCAPAPRCTDAIACRRARN